MNKKYCIMDMDGTLIDSMSYWNQLGYEFLRSKGISGDITKYLNNIKAMTLEQSAFYFKECFNLKESVIELHEQMNNLIANHYIYDIPLKKGSNEYLLLLKEYGVNLCIATATDKYLINCCLERLKIRGKFDFIISCEEVGEGKSSPAVFNKCAEIYDVPSTEIAVFDDAFFAIRTANEAGYYTVGIYDEYSSVWEDIKVCANEYFSNWKDAYISFRNGIKSEE